jgi:hypothetical protein
LSIVVIISVIVAVSVVCRVTADGTIVTLLLTTGVTVDVLRTVWTLVVKIVGTGCKQEHTKATSGDGRARMLEKTLAWTDGSACLFA